MAHAISGSNYGANMGDDTVYSGTAGTPINGFLRGIPWMAMSRRH